ncbi:hypothetical protein BBD41_23255 [Paenibacillus ihbetae]|uniref:2'-5' RNA ligase n=1 Tax=Paenibacillus ihbetae TaxID=1870820 RepID=A0A1B2E5J6_9BACL|nr:2'-5' RNA ligase family protein [Paenibacillus ihbetae]ANY75258.1 hypothetical protein BBD41_23255 [Paenibacillus ihbetae]
MEFFFGIVPETDIYEKVMSVREKYCVRNGSDPHITVKASCGLSEDMSWLSKCRKIISEFESFQITVGAPKYFGDRDVLYLDVQSEELIELHKRLVAVLEASEESINRCFELELYKPHITVARKSRLSEATIEEMRKDILPDFKKNRTFSVSTVSLFYRANKNEKYRRKEDIKISM